MDATCFLSVLLVFVPTKTHATDGTTNPSCTLATGLCSYNVQLAPPGGCNDSKIQAILARVEGLEKRLDMKEGGTVGAVSKDVYDRVIEQLNQAQKEKQDSQLKLATALQMLEGKTKELNQLTLLKSGHINALQKQLVQCKQDGQTKINVPRTCKGWREAGFKENGNYVIDPDGARKGVEPFIVNCTMDGGNNKTITVIHHNSENRILPNSNCATPLCSVRQVKYDVPLNQTSALIDISDKCQQFIKYECYHSVIYHASWYSRTGQKMDYWGGAQPGSGKCACGMTDSCDKKGLRCNCDANDYVWREDSGFLTDKQTLPVTQMRFGDLDDSKNPGYHTLGPLMCYN